MSDDELRIALASFGMGLMVVLKPQIRRAFQWACYRVGWAAGRVVLLGRQLRRQ
jgi:hypothetical protein